MDEDELHEAFLSIIAFSILFNFIIVGTIMTSLNPDNYLHIEYDPPMDFIVLLTLLIIDFVFLLYYIVQTSKFKKSHNLNYRKGELLLISDKMKVSCFLYIPLRVMLFYFYIKYLETGISIPLLLASIFEIGLILLIIYNSFQVNRING